jgi:AraC-like DNA-binding protein
VSSTDVLLNVATAARLFHASDGTGFADLIIDGHRETWPQLRTRVENAISSFLPHGRVLMEDVARSLGMSERTLARKLADEGLNFTEILQQLRRDLAVCYLGDRKLQISNTASIAD